MHETRALIPAEVVTLADVLRLIILRMTIIIQEEELQHKPILHDLLLKAQVQEGQVLYFLPGAVILTAVRVDPVPVPGRISLLAVPVHLAPPGQVVHLEAEVQVHQLEEHEAVIN